jgi:hypothetical protein
VEAYKEISETGFKAQYKNWTNALMMGLLGKNYGWEIIWILEQETRVGSK